MEVKVVVGDITEAKVDAIVVNLFEGVRRPGGATGAVDQALGGIITQLIADGEIKGKLNQVNLIHTMGKIAPARVAVVGLGKQESFTLESVRGVSAEVCKFLKRTGCTRIATIVHGAGIGGMDVEKAAQALTEGVMLGLYQFNKHKAKEPENGNIEELSIIERDQQKVPALQKGVDRGRVLAEATCLARDMINEPANFMTPSDMATTARKVAADHGLECSVLEREDMERLGMGALLGVAQGSKQPPKFIILNYKGGDAGKGTLGLIGKGLTFDSGGISIKPSEGMDEMKTDMSGGAAVIAAMAAIAQLKPRINVTGLVPSTENLPGGGAYKPGDVLKALNGKTIEVISTDAEGRLILADALSYARKLGLSPIVDAATLTGACRIALGTVCSGAFGNNPDFTARVIKAGEEAGERHWQMPMYEEYKEQNKSDVADVKNTGGRGGGGAITAAQFLAEFSGDTPWVHLDIAGTAWNEKERGCLVKGATGVAVRTFVNLALSLASES